MVYNSKDYTLSKKKQMILTFGYIGMNFEVELAGTPDASNSRILSKRSHTEVGGSALLQAVAAARCGARVSLIGTIGDDLFGNTVLETLRREGIQGTGLAKSTESTGFTHIITAANGQKQCIISNGANNASHSAQIPDTMMQERNLILLQNDLNHEINLDILERSKAQNTPTLLCLSHCENIHSDFFDNATITLIKKSVLSKTLPRGDYVVFDDIVAHYGFDAFCGTFAACIQTGLPRERAIQYANSAAALTTSKPGCYHSLPYLDDIKANL